MAKGKTANKAKFVDPFKKGVTYEQFINSIPEGVTVTEHLKGKCEDAQIEWLESEVKQLLNNKKK